MADNWKGRMNERKNRKSQKSPMGLLTENEIFYLWAFLGRQLLHPGIFIWIFVALASSLWIWRIEGGGIPTAIGSTSLSVRIIIWNVI
jgi:hypothetical protein